MAGKQSQDLRLSRRQWAVLRLVQQGQARELIAETLGMTKRTVDWHVSRVMYKSGTQSVLEALAFYFDSKLKEEYRPRVKHVTYTQVD